MKQRTKSKWAWYGVKLIFESVISGKPDPNKINKHYTNEYRNFHESIIIVKAQSFEHAFKIAEKKAVGMEIEYTNIYGELVNLKFVEAIHNYLIGDEPLTSGTEIYWRQFRVSKDMDKEDFLDKYYPESIEDDSDIFYNAILLNEEFSRIVEPENKDSK